jgi:hypothetical protein
VKEKVLSSELCHEDVYKGSGGKAPHALSLPNRWRFNRLTRVDRLDIKIGSKRHFWLRIIYIRQ